MAKKAFAFRGRIVDPSRTEELEDRLVDVSLAVGGYATVRRRRTREGRLRGVLLDLAPGLGTIPFVARPDGTFVPLAESPRARWIELDLRFADPRGRTIADELFASLVASGLVELERRGGAIAREGSSGGDGGDVLRALVRSTLLRPPEHPPVELTPARDGDEDSRGTEDEWRAMFRQGERHAFRITRALEEKRLDGVSPKDALEEVLQVENLARCVIGDEEESARHEEEVLLGADPRHEPVIACAVALVPHVSEFARVAELAPLVHALHEVLQAVLQVLDREQVRGWRFVQVERALRGAAHARGALARARGFEAVLGDVASEVERVLEALVSELEGEHAALRADAQR